MDIIYAFLSIIATMNLYYNLYCVIKRWPITNDENLKLGWISCAEALPNVITSAKVLLNLNKAPK